MAISDGFCTLEYGADIESVYNYSWINHPLLSGAYPFCIRNLGSYKINI